MRRLTSLIIAIIFSLSTAAAAPISFAADKAVTKDTSWFDYNDQKKSYKISTEAQLMGLCSLVNEEQTDMWKPTRVEPFEGVTFTLTRDIELTKPWTPIGGDDSAYFAGVFDGAGHKISNVNIKDSMGHSGFFGYLNGEVRNLTVEGKNISNDSNSGGIVGTLSSTGRVIKCTSNVKVKGADKCGGIVGNNEGGYVEGCINTGEINGSYKVGCIAGEN